MNAGRLIYVMGPSGAGKNSLIAAVRKNTNKIKYLSFMARYVTRAANSDDDDIAISANAFAHYRAHGLFALDWQAHGHCYGIGIVLDDLLRSGNTVVVNGSRAHLPAVLARYPGLTAVLVNVPPHVAQRRLLARGREHGSAVAARMARAPELAVPPAQLVTIDNSGPLEQAVREMTGVLIGSGRDGGLDKQAGLAG